MSLAAPAHHADSVTPPSNSAYASTAQFCQPHAAGDVLFDLDFEVAAKLFGVIQIVDGLAMRRRKRKAYNSRGY